MPKLEPRQEVKLRAASIARAFAVDRAIKAQAGWKRPNFWIVIDGALLNTITMDWCVLFGSHNEEAHWKNVILHGDHDCFRAGILTKTSLTREEWKKFHTKVQNYRDKHVAHLGNRESPAIYPDLDVIIASTAYYYDWLFRDLPKLDDFVESFSGMTKEAAEAAVRATASVQEFGQGRGTND
jgi:hypothetical protein